METNVRNNQDAMRFEMHVNNYIAFIEYKLEREQMTLVHTEVPSELGGQGIGGRIVNVALNFAERNGFSVVAECPFARHYIQKHEIGQEAVEKNDG